MVNLTPHPDVGDKRLNLQLAERVGPRGMSADLPSADHVLVKVAQRLAGIARESDSLIRWGGEEFLLVCRSAQREDANQMARRILSAIADSPFDVTANADVKHHKDGQRTLEPLFGFRNKMKAVKRTHADLHQTWKGRRGSARYVIARSFGSPSSSQKKEDRSTVRSTGVVVIGAGAGDWRSNRSALADRIANEFHLSAKDSAFGKNKSRRERSTGGFNVDPNSGVRNCTNQAI